MNSATVSNVYIKQYQKSVSKTKLLNIPSMSKKTATKMTDSRKVQSYSYQVKGNKGKSYWDVTARKIVSGEIQATFRSLCKLVTSSYNENLSSFGWCSWLYHEKCFGKRDWLIFQNQRCDNTLSLWKW